MTPGAQELSIASRAASPPNEAPYPTLVGTATSGTPVSPPTTRRQRALHAGDHDQAVGRREPVADRRAAGAARRRRRPRSASTPAPCTADGERRLGRDRRVGGAGADHRDRARAARERAERHGAGDLVDDGLGQRRARPASSASRGEPGGEHRALGVPLVQRAQDRRRPARASCRRRRRPRGRRCARARSTSTRAKPRSAVRVGSGLCGHALKLSAAITRARCRSPSPACTAWSRPRTSGA